MPWNVLIVHSRLNYKPGKRSGNRNGTRHQLDERPEATPHLVVPDWSGWRCWLDLGEAPKRGPSTSGSYRFHPRPSAYRNRSRLGHRMGVRSFLPAIIAVISDMRKNRGCTNPGCDAPAYPESTLSTSRRRFWHSTKTRPSRPVVLRRLRQQIRQAPQSRDRPRDAVPTGSTGLTASAAAHARSRHLGCAGPSDC